MENDVRLRLHKMFYPKSIALFGAGASPDKVGHAIMDSIVTGRFKGRIYPIHPRHDEILGIRVYKSLDDLPEIPDLAVIALNQHSTVEVTRALSEKGVAGASVIAGGYAEMGPDGMLLQDKLREAAGDMPLVGPNTLGFLNTWADLNVTFYPRILPRGTVSFLSQSGGIGLAFKGKASDEGLGISKWIGVGNRVNLEFETLLQYFADDPHTDVIGIFTEGSSNPRAFVNQIRAMSSRKPVVVYKGGRGEGADHITASHTGALAGSNRIWEGALAQAGAEIVGSASEMITVCKALALGRTPAGKRMGIFTHTAGPSIVAWDVLQLESDCSLADLESTTYQKIGDVLGPSVPVIYKNPVDGAGGAFLTKPFHDIAEIMLQDPNMDALLAIFCEHKNWQYPSEELISLAHQYTKTIVACFIGSTQHIEPYRTHMHEAGIPTYVMPEDAARGLLALLRRTS